MLDPDNAGRAYGMGHIRDIGKANGGDTGGLDLDLGQSNGPAADGSTWHQNQYIHTFFLEIVDDGRDAAGKHFIGPGQISHDRIVRRRDLPNLPGGLHLGQALDGELAIQILTHEIRVDMQVIDLYILLGGRAGDDAI